MEADKGEHRELGLSASVFETRSREERGRKGRERTIAIVK